MVSETNISAAESEFYTQRNLVSKYVLLTNVFSMQRFTCGDRKIGLEIKTLMT